MTAPEWIEVSLDSRREEVEAVEQWLFDAGALSVTLLDSQSDDGMSHAVLEPVPGEVRLWERVCLVGLFAKDTMVDQLHNALHLSAAMSGMAMPVYRLSTLAERAWERAWMDAFKPMKFGPKFWVCPTEQAAPDSSAINLRLDPGLAFGTGTHATTAQCLSWMGSQTAQSLRPLQGRRVIDYGCGSGVLAIAALLLGAKRAWAVDIDPQALIATHNNAVQNNVSDSLETGMPELVDNKAVELVLANILYKPLIDLAETISKAVVPGGTLVVSGILSEQAESLRLRYQDHFNFFPDQSQDGWVLMSAIRR